MSSHSSISSFDDLESPSSESNLLRSPVTFTAPKSGPDYYYDDLIPPPVAPVALKIHREFYIRDSLVDIEVCALLLIPSRSNLIIPQFV